MECVGKVTYLFMLLANMKWIHIVFHVLFLYKYISNTSHILRIEDTELVGNLVYAECPIPILDHLVKQLRNKQIHLV